MQLAVIGTVYVDIKGHPVGEFIPAGRNVGTVEQFHGGVGRNIAEDLANLGVDTMFVGLVDEGGMGAEVVRHLDSRGINTDFVRATKDGMGTWLAIFDETGEVCANLSKRPELGPLADLLDTSGDEIFSACDAVLLEIDVDEDAVKRTFDFAEKYGRPVYAVISNMSIARSRLPYIRRAACFVCNRQEAAMLFTTPAAGNPSDPTEQATIETAPPSDMLWILDTKTTALGIDCMVVTMDSDGAAYINHRTGESGICPALRVDVVDTTGAGDSFFAGVSAGLSQGSGLAEACGLGTRLASRVIAGPGNVYTE